MNTIWIVVFAALIQPEGHEYQSEQLAYVETGSLEECRATVPVFIESAIKHPTISDAGVTTDCFEYSGTLQEYIEEEKDIVRRLMQTQRDAVAAAEKKT